MTVIYMACGQDGTRNFTGVHPRDYLDEVQDKKVGWLESTGRTRAGTAMSLFLASALAYSLQYAL